MNSMIISKSNEKVKFIKSLNDKKNRQKSKCFYLEGIKVISEVLKSKAINLKFIAYSKELILNANGGNLLLRQINKLNEDIVYEFSKSVFESVVDTKAPQGVLAVLEIPNNIITNENENILLLDRVQDAGNLGTIIRSADAFNISQIICMNGTVDTYSPKVLRSTMGSILREKIIYFDNVKKIIELKKKGYIIVGTVLDENSILIENLNFQKKYIFIMGNEANGISKELRDICDIFVKISMCDSTESLNVSVATSILLYEQFKNKKK